MAKLTARDGGANIYDISVCRRHQTVSVQTLSLQMRAFPVMRTRLIQVGTLEEAYQA